MAATTGTDKISTSTSMRVGNGIGEDADQGVSHKARQVADTVAGAAGEVSVKLPEVATTARDAFTEANRMIHSGSDQTIKVGGAFSIGMALGMLLGGANRLLVVLALLPAGLIAATLIERTETGAAWVDTVRER